MRKDGSINRDWKAGAALTLGVGAIILAMLPAKIEREPYYGGHRLRWWVDRYGRSSFQQRNPGDIKALFVIGTNSLPYLVNWIRADEQPSRARIVASRILKRIPRAARPQFLVEWADENAFELRICERACSAAAVFAVLGTNAQPFIFELKGIVANPTNGYGCCAAELALLHCGPEGFTAVLEVIATPRLVHRAALMQGETLAMHMRAPGEMTIVGTEDPDFKVNSERAAPVLLKCLGDGDPQVRRWAFMLLSHAFPGSVVPAITNFLSASPPAPIRRQASQALAEQGEAARDAVPFLLSRSGDPDPEIRAEASNALMQITAKDVNQSLSRVR